MKRWLLLFLFLPATLLAQSSLLDSLVASWKLHERSGTRRDIHGSMACADFTYANDEYLTIADNADLSFGDENFALSFWWKTDNNAQDQKIIDKWKSTGNDREYQVRFEYDAGGSTIVMSVSSDGTSAQTTDGAQSISPTNGVWYHIYASHNATRNVIQVSIDGIAVTETAHTGGCNDNIGDFTLSGINAHTTHYISGDLDFVTVWNDTLTNAERHLLRYYCRNYSDFLHYDMTGKVIAHWDLDELGSRFDAHGNNDLTDNNTVERDIGIGNHLTDNNTVLYSASGKVMNAADFEEDTNEYLSLTDNPFVSFGDEDFSGAIWVYTESSDADMDIIIKASEYRLWYDQSVDQFAFTCYGATNTDTVYASTLGAVADATFYLLDFGHSKTDNEIWISGNGGARDTQSHTDGCNDGSSIFYLSNNSAAIDFDGLMDAGGLWRRQTTLAEVDSLYLSDAGREYPFNSLGDNLYSVWSLDGHIGSSAQTEWDEISASNNATDTNGPIQSTTAKIGFSLDFETGSSEYLTVVDNTDQSFGDEDFCISVWVYLESKPTMGIVSKWDDASDDAEYTLRYQATPVDRYQFRVSNDGTAYATVNADNYGVPPIATWAHIMAWHDASANTINIQVDNGAINSTAHTTGCNDNISDFNISAIRNGALQRFDGLIDDVMIWRSVISATLRTVVYSSGDPSSDPESHWPFIGTPVPPPAGGNPARRAMQIIQVAPPDTLWLAER